MENEINRIVILITKMYNKYFSKKRLKILKIFSFIIKTFQFLLQAFILPFLIVHCITICTSNLQIDESTLITISYALFGVAVGMFLSIIIAIHLSLSSNNEYFNQVESKLFFRLRFFKLLDITTIAINAVFNIIIGFIYALQLHYVDSIVFYIYSIIVIFLFLALFCVYIRKNKHERFQFYLTHSVLYRSNSSLNMMIDYLYILHIFEKNKDLKLEDFSLELKKRIYYINIYITEMSIKIVRDENVNFEQNILEEFFISYSRKIKSPMQLMSLLVQIKVYIDLIDQTNSNLLKDKLKTRNNMHLILKNIITSRILKFFNLSYTFNENMYSYLLNLEFMNTVTIKYYTILSVQLFYVTIYKEYIKFYETENLLTDEKNELLLKFIEKVEFLNEKIETNMNNANNFLKLGAKTLRKSFDDYKKLND